MSDLADEYDPTQPLERIAAIAEPIQRTSSALEAAARGKAEAERLKAEAELDELRQRFAEATKERTRHRQIIAAFAHRVPCAADCDRWEFSREELNEAPILGLKIGELKTGGAFVEL